MKVMHGLGKEGGVSRLAGQDVSRREFMKFCAAVSAALGASAGISPEAVAKALTDKARPSVIYLHNSECTGCSEAILRAAPTSVSGLSLPGIDSLILDVISLDYHETIMAAAGEKAEEALHQAMHNPNGYICAVEGAIPMAEGGIYGKIAGKTMYDMTLEVAKGAKAIIAHGNCATFGNVPAAAPNPTGCKGFNEVYAKHGLKAINIAGCPPNPINFVGAVVYFLTKGMPELDEHARPLVFFGKSVHDQCERLKYFEAGKFAPSFDSEEARKGYCLYELGCKGPYTYNNCPSVKFNQTNWPVQAGHPCIGCSEPGFWDNLSPFYEPL